MSFSTVRAYTCGSVWPIVLDVEVHGFDELDAIFSEQGDHGNAAYLVVGNELG